MAKEENSWKKRAEGLSNETIQLSDEIKAYLSKSKSSDKKDSSQKSGENPRIFEELVLGGIYQMAKLQIEMLSWLAEFQWMSKKLWWIGIFATLLITIFVAIIF